MRFILFIITASMLSGQTWQDPFNNFDNWTNTTSSSGEAWVISSDGYQGNCAQSSSSGTGYGDQLIKEHTFAR